MLLLKRSKITVWERHVFKIKKICYGSFRYVSTLCKKVFSRASLKCFSLYGSNNSDSVLSRMPLFKISKITVWKRHLFKNEIVAKVLGMCLPSVKRYFHEHQWGALLFVAQLIQILLFLEMPLLLRSKIIVWERHFFKKILSKEVLRLCLPYVKTNFEERQRSTFHFMVQITQICFSFWECCSWRDQRSVWERHVFKKKSATEVLGMCLPYVIRYFQEQQWSAFLFLAQITQILFLSRMWLLEI